MIKFVKNLETDIVYPATKILLKEAERPGSVLAPCDEQGNKIGGRDSETGQANDLAAELERLKARYGELEAELEMYKREASPPEDPTPTSITLAPNRMDELVRAIGELERDNPDHFTRQGVPRVEVLEAFAQIPEISASERDEAWDRFNSGD